MNKKIKMIELLNMIANGELKNNTKFNIINEDGDIIKCKYSSTYPGYIWVIGNEKVSFNYKIDHLRILGYEVEILENNTEDNTEEIEELDYEIDVNEDEYTITKLQCYIQLNKEKINKLVREARQQRKINDEIMMCLKRTSDFLGDKGYSEVRNYIERAEKAVDKLRKEKE